MFLSAQYCSTFFIHDNCDIRSPLDNCFFQTPIFIDALLDLHFWQIALRFAYSVAIS